MALIYFMIDLKQSIGLKSGGGGGGGGGGGSSILVTRFLSMHSRVSKTALYKAYSINCASKKRNRRILII